jgi:hypothetical protein
MTRALDGALVVGVAVAAFAAGRYLRPATDPLTSDRSVCDEGAGAGNERTPKPSDGQKPGPSPVKGAKRQEERARAAAYKAAQREQSVKARAQQKKTQQEKGHRALATQENAEHESEFGRDANDGDDAEGEVPRRLLRAERVLSHRTERFVLVLECAHDARNEQAVLRTAEAMGVQHVWIVTSPMEKNHTVAKSIVKGSTLWLTIRCEQYTALATPRSLPAASTRRQPPRPAHSPFVDAR